MSIQRLIVVSCISGALSLSGCSSLKNKDEGDSAVVGPATSSEKAPVTEPVDESRAVVVDAVKTGSAALSAIARKALEAGLTAEGAVVSFDYDSSELSGEDRALLDRHVAFIKANPDARVVLAGHTDDRGTVEYNMALGERRAKAVAFYLQAAGVRARQLEVVSFGELRPVAQGQDEQAWAQNRRVEISYR